MVMMMMMVMMIVMMPLLVRRDVEYDAWDLTSGAERGVPRAPFRATAPFRVHSLCCMRACKWTKKNRPLFARFMTELVREAGQLLSWPPTTQTGCNLGKNLQNATIFQVLSSSALLFTSARKRYEGNKALIHKHI